MLIERIARHNWTFGSGVPSCSRIFVDPGLGTAIGFLFWLYTLAKGGTVVVRGPDAVETMQAFILYNVQCMVASPAALAEFVGYYEKAPTLTAPLALVLSVGGPLPRSLSERLRARICSNLIACYGSTEANIVATAPAHAIADTPGAVGTVTPGVTVSIVDRSGNPVPAGAEGLVRISGPYTVAGYRGDAEGALTAFRDGWFYPGDIGRLTDDRLLVLSGREKEVLNLGGDKVSPERIEQVLASFAGVRQAAAFAVPNAAGIEELAVAVVAASFDAEALRRHCERELPAALVPALFIQVADIPRNDMGKIDRRRLAETPEGVSDNRAIRVRWDRREARAARRGKVEKSRVCRKNHSICMGLMLISDGPSGEFHDQALPDDVGVVPGFDRRCLRSRHAGQGGAGSGHRHADLGGTLHWHQRWRGLESAKDRFRGQQRHSL